MLGQQTETPADPKLELIKKLIRSQSETFSGPKNFATMKSAIMELQKQELINFENKEARKENISVEASRKARLE